MNTRKAPRNPRPRVLLVDGDTFFRMSLKKALVEKGFEVRTAYDGVEGVELLLNDSPFSIVISHQDLSRMDGISFLSAASTFSHEITTVLLLEADSFEPVLSNEISLFLKKPFDEDQWVRDIESTFSGEMNLEAI
ncbi:MAG: hypothetical protein COW89_10485 [Nitrospinae bacterium CG22_combo_CG10-13_8_21_14_all_47_10]|nr:MAG: hypothetical protein COW89_10485 [Nitrospinae bacterium CG22_combo_CG10-13_8_21_14_all_47_10]